MLLLLTLAVGTLVPPRRKLTKALIVISTLKPMSNDSWNLPLIVLEALKDILFDFHEARTRHCQPWPMAAISSTGCYARQPSSARACCASGCGRGCASSGRARGTCACRTACASCGGARRMRTTRGGRGGTARRRVSGMLARAWGGPMRAAAPGAERVRLV